MPAIFAFDTTVVLLRNIPLNPAQTYTITWATRAEQESWFLSQKKYTLVEFSYQRETGRIRVPGKKDIFTDVNYLMYQNKSFGSKWFYAFVTKVEYISGDLTEVSFQIDNLQTYWFQYHWVPTFVEREHVVDDSVGANLLPEPLDIGDYLYTGVGSLHTSGWWYAIASTYDLVEQSSNSSGSAVYGNVYSGVQIYVSNEVSDMDSSLAWLNKDGKIDSVAGIFQLPNEVVANDHKGWLQPRTRNTYPTITDYSGGALDGYVPRCNKMHTAPFKCLYVTNNAGQAATYRYEFFKDKSRPFGISGTCEPSGQLVCIPLEYRGTAADFSESIRTECYPTCCYVSNSYQNYIAQRGSQVALGFASSALSAVGGAAVSGMTGNPLGIAGAGITAMQPVADVLASRAIPNTIRGGIGGGNFTVTNRNFGFDFFYCHITKDYARACDDFMWAYGYNVQRVKVPNVWGRPYWNYVKTKDCIVYADANAEAENEMKAAMDRGITFWHTTDVGNYDLNNATGDTPDPPAPAPEPDPDPTPPPDPPIVTTGNAADFAEKMIGAVEWDSDVNKMMVWFYGTEARVPWCAIAASYWLNQADALAQMGGANASCTNWKNVLVKLKKFKYKNEYTPKRGDMLFRSDSGDRNDLTHTGIVTRIKTTSPYGCYYVSGNTGNPNGGPDGVFEKVQLYTDPKLIGYGEVEYS